jgi:hypothetical protein
MAQAVSNPLLTAEARVRFGFSPCGVYGGQSGTEAGFLRVIRFILSVSFHHDSSYSCRG